MLATFKLLTGVTDDVLAQYFVDKSTQNIKDYTRRNTKTVNTALKQYVIDLAVIYYNQRGAEGLAAQSYSGASESYLSDIPDVIRRNLNGYRYVMQEAEA